jgi:CheY-like chemotaxis protein
LLTGRKLLLADDSLTIQKVVSLTFNDEGVDVKTVGTGSQALAELEENLPDIVLADVFMPGPNGYELCERIKRDERTRHIPVLLLVGTFEPFNEAEARRVGADEVLTKPFQSIRDLVNKVGGLLGGSEEKNSHADQSREERRSDEETMQELSPFAAERATNPSESITPTITPADAFGDFDMDDATIQTTPITAFDAQTQPPAAFSEINEEEQFSDRGEMDEAFVLGDDPPVQAHAAITATSPASSAEVSPFAGSSAEASPVASSAFAAHTARAAEADDALLELGDSTPVREASDEADDFILDIGDGDAFDSPTAHEQTVAADDMFADDLLFGGSTPATVATQERKFFTEPEVAESSAPITETAPVMLAQEPEPMPETAPEPMLEMAPEEVPQQLWEEPAADISGFEWEAASAATGSDSWMTSATSFETATEFENETAPFAEVSGESQPVGSVQDSAPDVYGVYEQSPAATSSQSMSPEMLDELVRRVVAQMSEQVVREIAWEVVPDLAERLIRQRLQEEQTRPR